MVLSLSRIPPLLILILVGVVVTCSQLAFACALSSEEITQETFSFSKFTELYLCRASEIDSPAEDENVKNATHDDLRRALLKLGPPGSDVEDFQKFLGRVVERERKIKSIERDQKIRISKISETELRAFHIHGYSSDVLKFGAKFLLLQFAKGDWRMSIRIEDRKITDIVVDSSMDMI